MVEFLRWRVNAQRQTYLREKYKNKYAKSCTVHPLPFTTLKRKDWRFFYTKLRFFLRKLIIW